MTTERQRLIAAVDAFAAEMKKRLLEKLRDGWAGWREGEYQEEIGERMIYNATRAEKNNDLQSLVDAANLAMMRHNYISEQKEKP